MKLSVVIPALDEESALPRLLDDLARQQAVELQVIVADGGSRDATVERARACGAEVVHSSAGRPRQLNAGRRAARHEHLLFLHADTRIDSAVLLRDALRALQAHGNARTAGHFALRFARTTSGGDALFRYLEGKTRLNRPHTIHGDQGLLLRADFFDALGGYDEALSVMEDERIAARIWASGQWLLLPGELVTSARRFEAEGYEARYTLMALMMGMHAAGVDEFFRRAPHAYRAQREAARLDLRPFAALARELLRERGLRAGAAALWRAAGFVRDNAWQLAYRRDVHRADGQLRSLAFFDRHILRCLDNGLARSAAAILVVAWLWIFLPRRARQLAPSGGRARPSAPHP